MPAAVRPGGPANLAGIHYQLLRSLFHASRIIDLQLEPGDEPTWSRLVLEPPAGHDLELEAPNAIDLEQTKIRSTGPWPLSEVLEEVLPGLFHAAAGRNPLRPVREARFVTNAPRGQWQDVEQFFRELKPVDGFADPVVLALDNTELLTATAPAIEHELSLRGLSFTRQGLFLYVAQRLTARADPSAAEHRQVWNLLRSFRFEQIDQTAMREEVRARLRGRVLGAENVDLVLKGLVGDLLERGREGATIEANDLLAQHGLADRSLQDRRSLVERAGELLRRTLASRFREADDVRAGSWQTAVAAGAPAPAPLVLTGERGTGKSWALATMARGLAREGRLVLFVDAAQDFDATYRRAAAAFCHEVWGIDGEITLGRIHERLKTVDPAHAANWLDLLVDGVQGLDLAEQLAAHDWAASGIRLRFTLAGHGAPLPASLCGVQEVRIPDFTTVELHDYLERRLRGRALQVPYAESSILHRPFLARIFCDLVSDEPASSFPPVSEYKLLSGYWASFSRGRPIAVAALAELAAQPPGGRAYPWSMPTLRQAGLDDAAVLWLDERGLLRRSPNGATAELWHDRMLSWALAEGWATRLGDGELSCDQLVGHMREIGQPGCGEARWGRRWLHDALQDVIWLLLAPTSGREQAARQIVRALPHELPAGALARLGSRVVPTLFALLAQDLDGERRAVHALQAIDSPEVAAGARGLLAMGEPSIRLVAAEILVERPTAEALDALWDLRCELGRHDPQDLNAIYGIVEKALAACCVEADDWLRRAVQMAVPETDPLDTLVYLLARMKRGPSLWLELKQTIFAKVPAAQERCIVVCLESFHDAGHIDWLEGRVQRDDAVGAAARRALVVLQPGRPPDPITGQPIYLGLARSWWLLPHLNADPELAREFIAETVAHAPDPLQMAWSLLAGFESRLGPETLDLLLDATAERLAEEIAHPSPGNRDPLWGPFVTLAKVMSLALIARFEARGGRDFERDLARWLRERGPNNERYRRHREERAVGLLKRIGGEGLSAVADQWLGEGHTVWGLQEAIDLAVMRPTAATADLLLAVATRDAIEGSEHPIAQVQAIGGLVTIGRTDLAIRGTMKFGQKLPDRIISLFADLRPSEADLQPALAVLADPGSLPDPNAVLTLGLGGRRGDVPAILGMLRRAPRGSELAVASLLALLVIGDAGHEAVLAFIDHLQSPSTAYVCARGLLQLGAPEGLDALARRLEELQRSPLRGSDVAVYIAANLLSRRETRLETARRLWRELPPHTILFVSQGELSPFADLQLAEVDEWLYAIAFGTGGYSMDFGAQTAAIRALAQRDPDRAFAAALRLVELGSANRDEAPELLLEIDPARARSRLREVVRDDDEVPLLTAIGESLQAQHQGAVLLDWLHDPSPRVCEGACIAAEVFSPSADLQQTLQKLLYDNNWDVRTAANEALDRIWHTREVELLVETILAETDATRRWCLLDVVLAAGYPGLWCGQPWVAKLLEGSPLPLAMRQRVRARLAERRKEVRDEIEKRTRPSA